VGCGFFFYGQDLRWLYDVQEAWTLEMTILGCVLFGTIIFRICWFGARQVQPITILCY
jgi:hypothetical protein